MDKILRVNMGTLKVTTEPVPKKYAGLGGRGLTSQILLDEVEPACHPLGEFNKIVFAPGLLTGTTAANSGRLSVGGKSPLTGGIKEANAGGVSAQKLASLGYKAIIVEGIPKGRTTPRSQKDAQRGPQSSGSNTEFYILHISEKGAELLPANELTGLGAYALNAQLRTRYGHQIGVICIGPAGEMLMANAGVSTSDGDGEPSRYAGRGGLGAVMGSKGLKAIVVDTARNFETPVKDPAAFNAAAKRFAKAILDHPVTSQGLPSYGTAVLVNILNEAGGLPTRNFSSGRFEGAARISGEAIAETATRRGGKGNPTHACMPGCIIRCSNVYPDEQGEVLCSPIEYETAWSLGANCGIDNLDTVAMLNRICNDVGLDTIEAGVTLGVAMEAGLLKFGDGPAAIQLLEEVRKGSTIGRLFGQGAEILGKTFGVTRIPTVKGQGMPAYDPRAVKGMGVTYATSPMGADHTAGYSVTANILKVGGYVDPLKPEGQVELSRNLQVATAAVDTTGLCLFVAFPLLDIPDALQAVVDMLNAQYGLELTLDDVSKLGESVLEVEREFNRLAGFTRADDRLPEFFRYEPLPPHNTVFDVPDAQLDTINAYPAKDVAEKTA